jgi:signal transduction histidine kinase
VTRIRIALLAVAVGLGVPVALLAWRALDGIALERDVRHQALAERAFDEMERALSAWLEDEEARPFEHYRFYAGATRERSPLAGPPGHPFVLGAFQIDPDGSVNTPLRPDPAELAAARERGDWPPAPEVEQRIERITRLVEETWRSAPTVDALLAPGTTRPVGGLLAKESIDAAEADAAAALADDRASVYQAIQRLNLGAEQRSERKQKIEEVVIAPAAPSAPAEASALSAPEPAREDPARQPAAKSMAKSAVARTEVVRAALDPMVGRAADDAHLLLYRTVLVGRNGQGFRQGLVLDRAALGAWLSERALGATGLSQVAELAFDPKGEPDASAIVFEHRFAEPFDALTARLTLAPLPGVGRPGAIYALVALLALVGAAGLFAVERMVALAVHFAERRSNFVSAVTHELKTPLTAIRMYAEMLRDGLVPSEPKRREYYATITDESERLSRLIDNVLEFSRLSRGVREMDLRVGPVGPVLTEAADKLRAHAAREGFTLEVAVDPDLPPVRYDRDALLQVLFNLVDNAVKYARRAPARRVLLEARRSASGVELSVRDFGPGVAGRHLSRIFEPFYRGEDELTRSATGTGIGLALVRELAERMGAAVRGANAPGGGFQVCLAFRAEPA